MLTTEVNQVNHKPLLLVFPFGLLSHYLRCLVLCRTLRHHFEIRFLFTSALDSFVKREGFGTFECKALDPDKAIAGVKNFDFSWLKRDDLEEIYEAQVRVIHDLNPDFVLGDFSPTLKMAAGAMNVTYISLMNGYMSKYYASTRKISADHPAHNLVRYLPSGLEARLTRFGEAQAFRQLHKPFREIRIASRLSECASYLDELEGDVNLVCDLPEVFPQKKLPSHYHIVGPLYFDSGNGKPEFDSSLEESNVERGAYDGFSDGLGDATKKTIVVTMGSSGNWQQVKFLLRDAYRAYNIIAVGDAKKILSDPAIIHLPFVGMHDIFPHTDLIICHGGNGTMYQAMYYGIPVLVSTNHCEQEWNLAAFQACGSAAGLIGLNYKQKLALVERVLSMKQNKLLTGLSMLVRNWEGDLPAILDSLSRSIIRTQATRGKQQHSLSRQPQLL